MPGLGRAGLRVGEVLALRREDPPMPSTQNQQHHPTGMVGIVKHELRGHYSIRDCVTAHWVAGIEVEIPLGKVARRNVHAYRVTLLKEVAATPYVEDEFGDVARRYEAWCTVIGGESSPLDRFLNVY